MKRMSNFTNSKSILINFILTQSKVILITFDLNKNFHYILINHYDDCCQISLNKPYHVIYPLV